MSSYLQDDEGKFIPATQRPDGTWRKARRVKEGYVPQEEVPLYESKGKQFAQRKTGLPPGMCPAVVEAAKKEREKKARAQAKLLEKNAAASVTAGTCCTATKQQKQTVPGVLVLPKSSTPSAVEATAVSNITEQLDSNLKLSESGKDNAASAQDVTKKLRNLRKKLREIDAIEEKLCTGELKKPDKDQLDKVKRKKDIVKEIKRLEEEENNVEERAQ